MEGRGVVSLRNWMCCVCFVKRKSDFTFGQTKRMRRARPPKPVHVGRFHRFRRELSRGRVRNSFKTSGLRRQRRRHRESTQSVLRSLLRRRRNGKRRRQQHHRRHHHSSSTWHPWASRVDAERFSKQYRFMCVLPVCTYSGVCTRKKISSPNGCGGREPAVPIISVSFRPAAVFQEMTTPLRRGGGRISSVLRPGARRPR